MNDLNNEDWCEQMAKKPHLTGCSCCDPTADSPDPVVQRLERELDEANKEIAILNEAVKQIHNARVEAATEGSMWKCRALRAERLGKSKDAEMARLNDLLADRGNIISDMSHRIAECQDREEKARNERDDNAHVIIEACVIPGCDYHCRCDACRRVVTAMDDAGCICALETDERWWDESEAKL